MPQGLGHMNVCSTTKYTNNVQIKNLSILKFQSSISVLWLITHEATWLSR